MLRFHISIKNNLIIGVVVKKLLWSQNRAHFVEFGVNRLQETAPKFYATFATLFFGVLCARFTGAK